jgi:hypothetical protein
MQLNACLQIHRMSRAQRLRSMWVDQSPVLVTPLILCSSEGVWVRNVLACTRDRMQPCYVWTCPCMHDSVAVAPVLSVFEPCCDVSCQRISYVLVQYLRCACITQLNNAGFLKHAVTGPGPSCPSAAQQPHCQGCSPKACSAWFTSAREGGAERCAILLTSGTAAVGLQKGPVVHAYTKPLLTCAHLCVCPLHTSCTSCACT